MIYLNKIHSDKENWKRTKKFLQLAVFINHKALLDTGRERKIVEQQSENQTFSKFIRNTLDWSETYSLNQRECCWSSNKYPCCFKKQSVIQKLWLKKKQLCKFNSLRNSEQRIAVKKNMKKTQKQQ